MNESELRRAHVQLEDLKYQTRGQGPMQEGTIGYFHTILDRLTPISASFQALRLAPDEVHSCFGITIEASQRFHQKIDEAIKVIATLLAPRTGKAA